MYVQELQERGEKGSRLSRAEVSSALCAAYRKRLMHSCDFGLSPRALLHIFV